MTHTQAQAVEADREAAANYADVLAQSGLAKFAVAAIRAGRSDDSDIVQAFARHRIAAAEAMKEAAAKVARDYDSDGFDTGQDAAEMIELGISQLPTPSTMGGGHND